MTTLNATRWVVQQNTGGCSGWNDVSSDVTPGAARLSLASARSSHPQFVHRLVYREPGCPDAVLPD